MFRHLLTAALRNLSANRLQSAIAIFGLAIGLMAAITASLVAFDAFADDNFVPDYKRLYFAIIENHSAKRDQYLNQTSYDLAAYLRTFPEIDKAARIGGNTNVIGHGDFQARDFVEWADPDYFRIYRAPVLFGDLDSALAQPDGIVITREMARKYFGRENVLGETLMLNHKSAMTVRAVIEGWRPNAGNFSAQIYASSLAPNSVQSQDIGTQGMSVNGGLKTDVTTLVRLRPGASVTDLNKRASDLIARFVPPSLPFRRAMHFERVDLLNMSPTVHPENLDHLYFITTAALVILILSCVNFINLSIARSTQRGLEVAIRKTSGAARSALIVQFLGESVLQVLFALLLAAGLVEWTLPSVNAVLSSSAEFNYWRDPVLVVSMLTGALLVGLLAGIYPAFILSAFRPAAVLKGWVRNTLAGQKLRQLFVALQFAAMIFFLVTAGIVFRQNQFATTEAMRVPTDQTLLIHLPKCSEALQTRMAALPGVRGAACSSLRVLPDSQSTDSIIAPGGSGYIGVTLIPVGFDFLELYGLKPDAGRFFHRENGDAIPDNAPAGLTVHYVVNEAAIHQMGFRTAEAAIGQPMHFPTPEEVHLPMPKPGDPPSIYAMHGTIIGVVKDFAFVPEMAASMSSGKQIPPIAYSVGMPEYNLLAPADILHVKLVGHDIPETLSAIDNEWKKSGAVDPIIREFLSDYIQRREMTILNEGQAFATFAVIAMLLSCLGLFGISLSTAARRTKEIGVRKAMGASTSEIVTLLLWQFAKPVLWANLIAWPLAWYAMSSWLSTFAYHIDLDWMIFAGATGVALLVALLTVAVQSIAVARAVPATALRYE